MYTRFKKTCCFSVNMTTEMVNTLKLFIFLFVLQLENCRNIHFNIK